MLSAVLQLLHSELRACHASDAMVAEYGTFVTVCAMKLTLATAVSLTVWLLL
jgi:hypothetical protein